MQGLLGVAAFVVAAGSALVIFVVLMAPVVHQQMVVLRLRRGLDRIDHVLADWQRDYSNGRRRAPFEEI